MKYDTQQALDSRITQFLARKSVEHPDVFDR